MINQILLSACYFLALAVLASGIYLLVLYSKIKHNERVKLKMVNSRSEMEFVRFSQCEMIDKCIVVVEDVEPYKTSYMYSMFKLKIKHSYV